MHRIARLLMRAMRPGPKALIVFALGLGSATAAFGVFHSVLISPLPYANWARVVRLSSVHQISGTTEGLAPADFVDVRDQVGAFEKIAAATGLERSLHGRGEPEFVQGRAVSWSFFPVLGVEPALGRGFQAEDDTAGASPVVLISHDLWNREFGARASAVGETLRLGDKVYSVIGVMPAGFSISGPADFWVPLVAHSPTISRLRGLRFLEVLALLSQAAEPGSAQAQLDVLSSRLERSHPKTNGGWSLRATSLRDALVGEFRPYLWALLGASIILAAIACGNVASLFLALSAQKTPEIAIRSALGASRRRTLSAFFLDGLLFSLLGACLGGLLAAGVLKAFDSVLASQAIAIPVRLNLAAWLFAFTLSAASGIVFAVAPTVRASRLDLVRTLRGENPFWSVEGGRGWLRRALVVFQVAWAAALCVPGTLLALTFFRLADVSPGLEANQVLTLEFKLSPARYPTPAAAADFASRMAERASAMDGVTHVGICNFLPLEGHGVATALPDTRSSDGPRQVELNYRLADAGFFRSLSIPLRAGRLFSERDRSDSPPVVVLNDVAARIFWGDNEDSLGQTLEVLGQEREVVGIVGGVRSAGLSREPPPELYLPLSQGGFRSFFLTAKSARPLDGLERDLRGAARSIDNQLPVGRVRSMASLIEGNLFDPWARSMVFGFFSVSALLLTFAGIYALVVTMARERRHELGVRMALGATRRNILGLILEQVSKLVGAGLLIGLALSTALSHLLESVLFGVKIGEPGIYVFVSASIVGIALIAGCIPALRSAHSDPMLSLRSG